LDSAASYGIKQETNGALGPAPRLSLLLFSAKSEVSLQGLVQKNYQYLEKHGSSRLRDIAYTLATRREHYEQRTFAVSDGEESLLTQPPARTKDTPKSLVFVFTGQGAQWAQMGKDLIQDFPSFRDDIRELDNILSQSHIPPSWSILGAVPIL